MLVFWSQSQIWLNLIIVGTGSKLRKLNVHIIYGFICCMIFIFITFILCYNTMQWYKGIKYSISQLLVLSSFWVVAVEGHLIVSYNRFFSQSAKLRETLGLNYAKWSPLIYSTVRIPLSFLLFITDIRFCMYFLIAIGFSLSNFFFFLLSNFLLFYCIIPSQSFTRTKEIYPMCPS